MDKIIRGDIFTMENYSTPIRIVLYAINFIVVMSAIAAFFVAYYSLVKLFGAYFIIWSLFAGWWFLDEDNSPFRKMWRANKSKR